MPGKPPGGPKRADLDHESLLARILDSPACWAFLIVGGTLFACFAVVCMRH